ncbi:arsenite transporter, partial [Tremellales sp. Uapishka_1]
MSCSTTNAPVKKPSSAKALLKSLSLLDRFLALWVFIAMVLGVVIGLYAPNVQDTFDRHKFAGVSIPLMVGMIVMIWPALSKVEYERIPAMMKSRGMWKQVAFSLVVNWIVGPFVRPSSDPGQDPHTDEREQVMLGCAWAGLPDLDDYRQGVIMVGLARCIAMVLIWTSLAGGDGNLCAIIVIINSLLQIILYSPYALLFLDVIAPAGTRVGLQYGTTAIAVLIYLGIPLVLAISTRFLLVALLGKERYTTKFLPYFGPLALAGLLYTIIIIFAQQAKEIIHNIGNVFRVVVPLVLYFAVMWVGTFGAVWYWSNRQRRQGRATDIGYEAAVVHAFTGASNNFELSIAVCVAVFGVDSNQALAATIGPLVEVPVLLSLTWVSLYLGRRLAWGSLEVDGPREAEETGLEDSSVKSEVV